MKTLDIALEYLNEIDFTQFNIDRLRLQDNELTEIEQLQKKQIRDIAVKYLTDGRLTFGNEYYHSIVFETALIYKKELSGKDHWFFPQCCLIIMQNSRGLINRLLNIRKFNNTEYPRRIIKKFYYHCNMQDGPLPYYINNEELQMDIFSVAYHYLITEK